MKIKKIQKRFVDHGCGFPVVIQNVPMVRVRGVWTPDINYEVFHKVVLLALAFKPTRLTGNQIKFIRHFFGLTLVEFGEYFDVTHPAVIKWEKASDTPPGIRWSIERDLRLFVMDRLDETPQKIGELYKLLRSKGGAPKGDGLDLAKQPGILTEPMRTALVSSSVA